MKNPLSENMLRFGTKNLSESAKQQLLRLTEAPEAAGGYDPFLTIGGYKIPGALKFKSEADWKSFFPGDLGGQFVGIIKNDTWPPAANKAGVTIFKYVAYDPEFKKGDRPWIYQSGGGGGYEKGWAFGDKNSVWSPLEQVEPLLDEMYTFLLLVGAACGVKDLTTLPSFDALATKAYGTPNLLKACDAMYDTDVAYGDATNFVNAISKNASVLVRADIGTACLTNMNKAVKAMWPSFKNVFGPAYNKAVSQYSIMPTTKTSPTPVKKD